MLLNSHGLPTLIAKPLPEDCFFLLPVFSWGFFFLERPITSLNYIIDSKWGFLGKSSTDLCSINSIFPMKALLPFDSLSIQK